MMVWRRSLPNDAKWWRRRASGGVMTILGLSLLLHDMCICLFCLFVAFHLICLFVNCLTFSWVILPTYIIKLLEIPRWHWSWLNLDMNHKHILRCFDRKFSDLNLCNFLCAVDTLRVQLFFPFDSSILSWSTFNFLIRLN